MSLPIGAAITSSTNISPYRFVYHVVKCTVFGGFFHYCCAAEAIFCCPTENSHHLKSWILSKDAAFHNEKESRRTWPRSQVSLEKSSKNCSRWRKWAKPNLTQASLPLARQVRWRVFSAGFPLCEPRPAELRRQNDLPFRMAKIRGEGRVICGLI